MGVVHWRGRTRPRGPSDGGAPQLKPGVNPLKSSTLRGSAAQFSARAAELVLRPSITLPKRRPRPGLEPVDQRGRPRGTPARWAKSRNSFRRALTATIRWSGEHTCSRWILQRRDRGIQGYAWLHFWGHPATLELVTSRGLTRGHRGAYNRPGPLILDLFRCCLTEQEE